MAKSTYYENILIALLIVVIVLAFVITGQSIREGIGKNQTVYKSFGERYKSVDNTYHALDAANNVQNSEKAIGKNVIDATVDPNQFLPTYAQDNGPRQDFNNLQNVGNNLGNYDASGGSSSINDFNIFATNYDRRLEPGGKNSSATYHNATVSICETINGFMLHENAITNMMATQFTAEQKLQINNFISTVNSYMRIMKVQQPVVAANWLQTSNQTRTSIIDVVIKYAEQQAAGGSDSVAQNLVTTYEPLKNNTAMMAYVQAMLLSVDMNDAMHNCNGSIIR